MDISRLFKCFTGRSSDWIIRFMNNKDYAKAKKSVIKLMEKDWGPRCRTSDLEDFPDMADDPESWGGRCPVCLRYEKLDKLFEMIAPDEDVRN